MAKKKREFGYYDVIERIKKVRGHSFLHSRVTSAEEDWAELLVKRLNNPPKEPTNFDELVKYLGYLSTVQESGLMEMGVLRASQLVSEYRHLFKGEKRKGEDDAGDRP